VRNIVQKFESENLSTSLVIRSAAWIL